jgi:very-short-patch-repair endonuclease
MQRVPPELTTNARSLRRDATPAERKLWQGLREQQPRWTRQHVVGHYILDFACRSLKIGVELDGGQHAVRVDADDKRTAYLVANGWSVLRFWNTEVEESADIVVAAVLTAVAQASTHPRPLPFREGG